jgi:hypothetical protein
LRLPHQGEKYYYYQFLTGSLAILYRTHSFASLPCGSFAFIGLTFA